MERERLSEPMGVREFQARFDALEPGESFPYHLGLLARDRLFSFDLDKLAERALILGTDFGDEIRPISGTTGNLKQIIVLGKGEAILVQRKNCIFSEYHIIKRTLPC